MQRLRKLIAQGYRVVPLIAETKKPAVKDWYNFKGLSLLEAAEHKKQNGNFAVLAGANSRRDISKDALVVIDFDIRTSDPAIKKEAIAALTSYIGDLKNHVVVSSGSRNGSAHIHLTCPVEDLPRSQIIVKTPDWEIDLKSTKTKITIPPSIHPVTHREYVWLRSHEDLPPKSIKKCALWGRLAARELDIDFESERYESTTAPTLVEDMRLSKRMRDLIKFGDTLGEYPSRSEAIYAAVHAMVGVGINTETIVATLTDPSNLLSEGVLERSDGWLLPQIKKADNQQLAEIIKEFDEPSVIEKTKGISPNPLRIITPNTIPPTEWIIAGRLVKKFITLTVAPGGAGKTTLTIQEALSVATGRSLGVGEVKEQGAVWIFNNEDPMDEMERRIAAIAYNWNLNLEELHRSGRVFVNSGRKRGERLLIAKENAKQGKHIIDETIEMLEKSIIKHKIKLVVIDPFARSHQLNENDNSSMDLVCDAFSALADRTNCSINLVHHCRKVGKGEDVAGSADTIRGASALVNAARIASTLTNMSKEEATKFGLSEDERVWYCRFDNAKNNLSAPSGAANWFKRVSVDLGNGREGIASEHRGVLMPWMPPELDVQGVSHEKEHSILNEVKKAWNSGTPYGAKNADRPLTSMMKAPPHSLSDTQIKMVIAMWETRGVLVTDITQGARRLRGYNARLD